jgi:predicted molibdopterin-dependent oxidoreductase YjgC
MPVNTLTIDHQLVSARQGETVLEAANQAGIAIPTLCYLDGISAVGACRLCLVEVEGQGKLLPACVTAAAEGMVVQTHSDRLQRYRRMIVELLLAEGNHVLRQVRPRLPDWGLVLPRVHGGENGARSRSNWRDRIGFIANAQKRR